MRIGLAQTKAIKGDIFLNTEQHKKFIDFALSNDANFIFFPELSLTGYEPTLAKALAIDLEDRRLEEFQKIANTHHITIGLGCPTKSKSGICISMLIFQAAYPLTVYSKKYLHADEEAFFASGQNHTTIMGDRIKIAPAICYEISVPEHVEEAYKKGAEIYIASVAKSAEAVKKAGKDLADIARKYAMPVLMANAIGTCDGMECGGKTSVWSKEGNLIGQLNNSEEGLIIFDTDSLDILKLYTI